MHKNQRVIIGLSIVGIVLICGYIVSSPNEQKVEIQLKPAKIRNRTSQNLAFELEKLSNKDLWSKTQNITLIEVTRDREVLLDHLPVSNLLTKKKRFQELQGQIKKIKSQTKQKLVLMDKIELELAIVLSVFYDSGIINAVESAANDKNLSSYDWSLLRNFSKTNDFKLMAKNENLNSETVNLENLKKTYTISQKNNSQDKDKPSPRIILDDHID